MKNSSSKDFLTRLKIFLSQVAVSYIGTMLALFMSGMLCLAFLGTIHQVVTAKSDTAGHAAKRYQVFTTQSETPPNSIETSESPQVVHVILEGQLKARNPHRNLPLPKDVDSMYIDDLAKLFAHAAKNDQVEGILLEVRGVSTTYVEVDALIRLIKTFKKSGKKIVCHITFGSEWKLAVAAQADKCMMYPLGELWLNGRNYKRWFKKGFLDLIGVRYTPFRSGKEKTYADDLIDTEMSPEAKNAALRWLIPFDARYLKFIAEGRGMDVATFIQMVRDGKYATDLLDNLNLQASTSLEGAGPQPEIGIPCFLAQEALEKGLVDGIGYVSDAKKLFQKEPQKPKSKTEKTPQKKQDPKDNHTEVSPAGKSTDMVPPTAPAASEGSTQNPDKPKATEEGGKPAVKEAKVSPSSSKGDLSMAANPNKTLATQKKEEEKPAPALPQFVDAEDYLETYCPPADRAKAEATFLAAPKEKRAIVIELEGGIRSGKSDEGIIGHEDTIERLKACAAVASHIFIIVKSPGGSAYASDMIRHSIEEIRKEGVYVEAIMGYVCASGGAMISFGCDYITCFGATFGASVGTTMAIPDMEGLLGKLQVNVDGVQTAQWAELGQSLHRNFKDEEKAYFKKMIQQHDAQFRKVAERGGKLTPEQVKKFAGGAVYFGKDLVKLGLADELIEDADAYIAKRMKQRCGDDYAVIYYKKKVELLEWLLAILQYVTGRKLYSDLSHMYHCYLAFRKEQDQTGSQVSYEMQQTPAEPN